MTTKMHIIEEIRRLAKENNDKPLGMQRFEAETGISSYQWKKHWARFGDAQKEAGFEANQLNEAYEGGFMIQKIIELIRELKEFPTTGEINLKNATDSSFPGKNAYGRFGGGQIGLANKVLDYCKNNNELDDVLKICESFLSRNISQSIEKKVDNAIGEVYLFKSGPYYKIGKTKDLVRRGAEIRTQLPEKLENIHAIKTDDPSGIEAYWHKRFSSKRMNGEWFNLSASDVRAFKLWRKIA